MRTLYHLFSMNLDFSTNPKSLFPTFRIAQKMWTSILGSSLATWRHRLDGSDIGEDTLKSIRNRYQHLQADSTFRLSDNYVTTAVTSESNVVSNDIVSLEDDRRCSNGWVLMMVLRWDRMNETVLFGD